MADQYDAFGALLGEFRVVVKLGRNVESAVQYHDFNFATADAAGLVDLVEVRDLGVNHGLNESSQASRLVG